MTWIIQPVAEFTKPRADTSFHSGRLFCGRFRKCACSGLSVRYGLYAFNLNVTLYAHFLNGGGHQHQLSRLQGELRLGIGHSAEHDRGQVRVIFLQTALFPYLFLSDVDYIEPCCDSTKVMQACLCSRCSRSCPIPVRRSS